MRGKMIGKKVLVYVMTFMMVFSTMPANLLTSYAEESENATDDSLYTVVNKDPIDSGGLYLDKQLSELNDNGEGVITLETYVTGKVTNSSVPTDIVLVLDQSGSMTSGTKLDRTVYKPTDGTPTQLYTDRENLYVKLADGSYSKVTVTRVDTSTEVSYEQKSNENNEWYYDNQYDLYHKCDKNPYGEITVTKYNIRNNTYYTYTCSNGCVLGTSQDDDGSLRQSIRNNFYIKSGVSTYSYTFSYEKADGTIETVTVDQNDNAPGWEFYIESVETVSGLKALQEAVTAFTESVIEQSKGADGVDGGDDDIDHRIAMVGFGSTNFEDDPYMNTEVFVGANTYTYGTSASEQYGNAFQDMSTTIGRSNIEKSIDALGSGGGTYVDLGLNMANGILDASTDPTDTTRNRVVIVFTDGAPGYNGSWGNGSYGNQGDATAVANVAISKANETKNNYNATVYTVGIFSGANASNPNNLPGNNDGSTARSNRFMHLMSSNYPEATSMTSVGNINTKLGDGNYYLAASDATALNNIFKTIGDNVQSETLDATTIVQDVMSQYFEVNLGESDIASAIHVYESDYLGSENGFESINDSTKINYTDASSGYTVSVDNETGKVSVQGFDFEPVMDSDTNGNVSGKKLIIQIPVKVKDSVKTAENSGATVNSNNTVSLKSSVVKDQEKTWDFAVPNVIFPVWIEGEKTWDDNDNANGTRPTEIIVDIYADGGKTPVATQTVTEDEDGKWVYKAGPLPQYKETTAEDGSVAKTEITYTIEERAVEGYITTYDGYNITNVKIPDPATVVINGSKTLNGRDMKSAETFSFNITAADEVTREAIAAGNITGLQTTAEIVTGGTDGTAVPFSFDQLQFTETGTYKFNITEDTTGSAGGVTYDNHTSVVTVVVYPAEGSNELTATVKYDNGDGKATDKAEFINTYSAEPAFVDLKVTKSLQFRDWLDSDSFSFTLKNDSLGINDLLTLTKDKKSGTFDSIEIDKPGEYTFKIKENIPSDAVGGKLNGITYDRNNERIVKVTVTDNGEGQLVANITGDTYTGANGEVFTNTYAPTPAQLSISGTKVMDGKTLNAGDFEFTITAAEGTPMPANTTVKNGEGEDIDRFTFGSIEYTEAGEYTYTIKETKGSAPGVAYDNSEITAIVTVAENQATGTLSANVVYKKGEETLNGLMFTNRYTVEPSDGVAFSASKEVTGHAYDLEAGKFSFTLSPSEDNGDNDPIEQDITVTNDEEGAVSFVSNAVYKEPGTYKYSVTEDQVNEIKGITYDNSTYLIIVTVKENTQTAKLYTEIAITKDGKRANAIVFSNNYKPDECTAVIKGKKSLSGKGMEAFTFQITQHQSTPNAPLPQYSEVQNDTAGVFEFNYGNITYTEAGTYVYEVTEKAVGKAGYTYDQSKYIVTVTVTDVNGELKSAVKYEKNGEEKAEMTFANDYTPAPVKVSIDGEKSLTGRDLNEGEFTFKLLDAKSATVETAVNGENGKFSFSDLTFTGTGTYTYTVVEDKSGAVLPGVTYSDEIYNVIIDVTDENYDGKLDAAVKYYKNGFEENGIEFTNTYKPAPAELTLSGTKTFTGRDMKDGESFEFVLSADKLNENAQSLLPNGMKVTVSDGKNGEPMGFTFGELTFTEPGTYRFDVNETKPDNTNGIIYDTDTVNVTVKVDHDVNNGRLVVSEVKYNEGLFDKENGIAFENTFEPVSAVFKAKKVLTGRDLNAGEFTFQLVDANDNVIQEKTNDAEGNIVFDAIEYDGTGNHTYTIKEVQGDLGGVSYDNVPVNVTATVTVDEKTEELVAVTAYEKNGSNNAVFNNSYTTESIEVGLTGQKVLTGRDLNAGEFSFELKDNDGNVLQTKENAAGGSITFDAVKYTQAGTYNYTISEVKGNKGGITYDEETVYVTVTVTDDGKGALSSSVTYSKEGDSLTNAAFTNTYSAAPASLSFSGSKVLTGRDLEAGEFSFVLKDAAGETIETVTNTANGTISFDAIEYTEAGTYTYTISEIKGDLPGITYYDEDTVSVTVTVTDDGKGALKAEAKYKKGPNGEEKGTFAFENTYQTDPADPVSVEAKKSVETNTGDRYVLKDGEFEFQIIPGQNPANDPVSAWTTKNDINGMIEVFSNAVYEQAGTYTYTMLEKNSGVPGFGYSTTKYEIKVDVSDDIEKAKLNADVTLTDITDPENPIVVEELVFVNTYDTKAATANIYGKKTVEATEGNSYTLKGGEFTFVLTPENENTPMPSNAEVTNLDTGAFTFGEIKYVRPGTYKYTVSEKAGDLQGFTYSDKEYNVTVTVTDVNSVLVAEVTGITDDDGKLKIDFTNEYEPEPVEVTFKAMKVMKTSDQEYALEGGDYNFQLKDSEKNIMQNKKNDANGIVSFDSITYTKPGNYTYYVSEEEGNDENLIYDDTGYQVDVTVTDNNGKLEAVVKTGNTVIDKAADMTFTNVYETVSINGAKVWDDASDQDGIRPDKVTVELLVGEKVVATKEISGQGDVWNWTFDNLPKYKNGSEIQYSVAETDVPDGYTSSVSGTTITNKHTPETTEVSVAKVWDDANNQDNIRPASITVQLKSGDDVVDEFILNEANQWTATASNLNKYAEGDEIEYTWVESAVPAGYTLTDTNVEGDLTTFTNTHIPETTEVSVAKVWDDEDNQDNIRPGSVEVQLYANSNAVGAPVELKGVDWTYTWTDLDKKSGGRDIVYTVDEVKVPAGYTKTVSGDQTNGFTITNKHTPETTEVLVKKVWDDAENQDGLRPDSITVQLKANGNNEGAAVTLDVDNNWQYRWTDLDKKSGGNDIEYTVDEVEVPEGYTKTVSGDQTNGFTITNKHTPETTEVLVKKVWDDAENQDGLRPDSITVQLKANGNNEGDAVILNANNNWQYRWTDLDKKSGGNDIAYTVDEVEVPEGYTKSIAEPVVNEDGTVKCTITNIHEPLVTDISVNKVWNDKDNQDNKRPSSVTVQLFVGETAVSEEFVLDESNNWQHTWTNLAVNDAGNEINYVVRELDTPDEYEYIVSGSIENGFTITNAYPVKKIDITAIKEWSDRIDEDKKRPDSVTIQLTANGENVGGPVVLDKNNNWKTEWKDLDCYKDGKLIDYRVIETKVPDGYTHEITKTANYTGEGDDKVITGYHFNVNNIYPIPKTAVSVSKAWDDADNQDGIRPEAVKVNLLANGKKVESTITLNKDNKWSYTWSDLNIYSNGSKINYTVEEVDVEEGYRPEVTGSVSDGFVITNKHKPAETSVTVTKKWEDNKNQDGMRPENVEVILSANGKQVGSSIELDKDNNWTHTWTGLAKNANGEPINYTVDEVEVPKDYTKSVAEPVVKEDGTVKCTITNSHVPMTTKVSVEKVWDDADNQDGVRPASINVILKADGQQVGTAVTLNSQNSWKHTWENLAVKNAGSDIEYTVEEKAVSEEKNEVENYTAEITGDAATGFKIINTHEPAETSFRVTKAWDDEDNQDNIRPASITVQLYANGIEHGEPIALGEANGWSYTWTELAKYENGVEIVYTVDETAIPNGYTKEVKGSTITNTHVPEVTQVTFTKKWVDNDNQDGKRPSNIQVQLYADGDKVGSPVTVTAADDWTYTWEDLAKNSAGEAITYTAKEVEVPDGYNASADGMTITNTHTPETINIEGTKTWDDNDDQDGVRPASITVRLLANGEEVRSAVVTEADDWSWLFEDLPKYEGGKEISYVITEDAVQDYSTAIEGYDIINTHAPGKTSITVTKSWNDRNDIAKVRPEKVSIQLYADGEPYGEAVTLDAKGSWSYTWAELDLKKAGKVIEYTVEEVDVPKGYEAEVTGDPTTGYIVTNTVDPKIIEDAIDTGDGSTPWGFGIASLFALCAAAGALFFRRRTE